MSQTDVMYGVVACVILIIVLCASLFGDD